MKKTIQNKIEQLLSKEYHCSPEELKKSGTVYSIKPDAERPYIKILAYKNCVLVCTSKDWHTKVKTLLLNRSKDEIFELPFVYGQTIHYIPDISDGGYSGNGSMARGYVCRYIEGKDILQLNGLKGFENSLAFDDKGLTPTKAVFIAKRDNRIIGVAGAAESSVEDVWEVGVDVAEDYRNAGLGTYLVRGLTGELLARGIVPFYSASVTNIASQMTAYRCGYKPFWIDTFGTTLDGSSVYNDIVKNLTYEESAG